MENATSFKRLPGRIGEARKFWVNSHTPCSTRVIRRSNAWTGTRFSPRWFPAPAPRELPGAPSPPALHPTARWISSQVGLGWGREGFRPRFLGHDAHLRNPALSPGVGAMSLPPCLRHAAQSFPRRGREGRRLRRGSLPNPSPATDTPWASAHPSPVTCWVIPWEWGRVRKGGEKSPPAATGSPAYQWRNGTAWAAGRRRPAPSRSPPSAIKEEKYFNAFMKTASESVNDSPAS